jgi:hypothetical protein
MKNLVLILGIALVSLTNVCNATNTVGRPVSPFSEYVLAKDNEGVSTEKGKIVKPSLSRDAEIFNPETVIAYNRKSIKEVIAEGDKIIENVTLDDLEFISYEESMKEIIAQSDLIIESTISNEIYPLYGERTLEDEIAELEMIIESTKCNETSPLNFKKIHSHTLLINTFNSKGFIGMN